MNNKTINKQFTIFDFVKAIVLTKPKWNSFTPEQKKLFQPFLIHRFLSMNPYYIDLVNFISGLNTQDPEKIYTIYCDLIPKSSRTYFPYIKGKSKEYNEELVEILSKYYVCSNKESIEYLELLSDEDLFEIMNSLGMEEKIIKKLIKDKFKNK